MKKLAALLMAGLMAFACTACGTDTSISDSTEKNTEENIKTDSTGNDDTGGEDKGDASYQVAIVQQLDHASLDEIRLAVEAELEKKADELGITITYEEFNGQNDATILNQIGAQVVSDEYDCIIPIATLAAQCMQMATEDHPIPVVFAAVTDPISAGVVESLEEPGANITGTSDYLDANAILEMMFAQNPDIKTVGLLYNKSEDSSKAPIEEAKKYLDEKGIAYVEKTGTTSDEIGTALDSMIDQVDAVFTPTDNTVAAAELMLAEKFTEAGIPHYTGADSFVRNGAYATCGVNYTDLGSVTADMAVEILQGAEVASYPVHVMDGGIITVNTETAEALGLDYSCFRDMCDQLVEVQTSEE